jgi:hypothetical protein
MTNDKPEVRLEDVLSEYDEVSLTGLRDRFAMAALTGLLSEGGEDGLPFYESASRAYRIADAMMEARNAGK